MKELSDKRRSTIRRTLVIAATLGAMASLGWLIADHLTAEDSSELDNTSAAASPTTNGQMGTSTTLHGVEGASGAGDTGPQPAATPPPTSPQADLGLDKIAREFILILWGGETLRAESDYWPSRYAKLQSDDPATKRRAEFELEVSVQLGAKLADDPYYWQLQQSMHDDWDLCGNDYGLPSVIEFAALSEEQQEALYEKLGLVGEAMTDFEDDCWQQARIYAGKDEETDRLLQSQHHYYLDAAQAWVNANPDKVVPIPE